MKSSKISTQFCTMAGFERSQPVNVEAAIGGLGGGGKTNKSYDNTPGGCIYI